ncbi:tRNA(Ile)-lysidine synthase [Cyanobacterium sp. HL-69]|uniref:tRNA lysidine(34) synthetase TilS n=1 Tax=Cyanobacterium sp. HL-69 TaxID=2054282 RepID=UPI000CA31063|nr:tRNA(Ile)-lysidine synthase [Cyanobacterium sp. HL-69]
MSTIIFIKGNAVMVWSDYHARLHQLLKNRQILPKFSKILVGLSGGQDSLCLTRLMLDLEDKWEWKVAIAHCDHNWTLDQGLAEHIEAIASNWGVDLYLETAQDEIPEKEAAARTWRYQVLTDVAMNHGFDYVVTAHTKSDRTETFLYNLIRGSGSDGLTSLYWKRKLTDEVELVRPLLGFSRQDTGNFCQKYNLPIWEDSYNQNKKFARNRIRLDLIPYLQKEFNPQVENHIAQTAEILRADREFLDSQAQLILKEVATNQDTIDCKKLQDQHLSLQRRVIKLFLGQNLAKMPTFEQIEAVVNLIDAPNGSQTSSFGGGRAIAVRQNHIVVIRC